MVQARHVIAKTVDTRAQAYLVVFKQAVVQALFVRWTRGVVHVWRVELLGRSYSVGR